MSDRDLTVILADGTFPASGYCLKLLAEASYLVCCDGAAAHAAEVRMPDAIVGDMDTLSDDLQKRFASIIHREAEQETNDLCKAFRFCLEKGFRRIVILGATGGRDDHTLGNLGHLVDFASEIPDISMITDDGEFSVLRHSPAVLDSFAGQKVSIFAPFAGTAVTSSGLKYPLKGLRLSRWWQGSLNESLADRFSLQFTGGEALLLFRSRK